MVLRRCIDQDNASTCPCLPLVLQQHRFTYNEPMPVESCTQSLCDLALRFGEDSDEAGMVSGTSQQHRQLGGSTLQQLHPCTV